MTQARRTYRRAASPNQQPIEYGLREAVLFTFYAMGLYLLGSLLSYDARDPGWSFRGQVEEIHNWGGIAGAWLADIFINLFGYFSYLFPIIVGYIGWLIFQRRHHDILAEPKNLIVPGIGFLLTLSAGCGLAIVHFSAESALLPSHAGGILGIVVGKSLQSVFSQLGATLFLIVLFFTGVTLLTGLSWLKVMDTFGFYTLLWLPIIQRFFLEQFLPLMLYYLQRLVGMIKNFFGAIWQRLAGWGRSLYRRWQDRRVAWQAEREEFLDNDDYYIKDDPLTQPADSSQPPLDTTVSAATTTEAVTTRQDESLLPALSLLDTPAAVSTPVVDTDALTQRLVEIFSTLQVTIEIKSIHSGPVVTGFEVQPTPMVDNLEEVAEFLTQSLQLPVTHVVITKPGVLGIEIPHPEREVISLHELLSTADFQEHPSPLVIALGKDVVGQAVMVDLTRVPHLLLAGSDSAEKNIALHTMLLSLLYKATPQLLRLVLIDSVTLDLAMYTDLPHLLTPVITETARVLPTLQWCEQEMERRYRLMAEKSVRNIDGYNQMLLQTEVTHTDTPPAVIEPLPYLVIVIPEMAEVMKTDIATAAEEIMTRLTQKARAAGIHLLLATQYPSINVITGLLKANMPNRIAFQVTSKSESRTILGQMGAETLLGSGDMLYMTAGTGIPVRVHGGFVSTYEVRRVVADLKKRAAPAYIDLQTTT